MGKMDNTALEPGMLQGLMHITETVAVYATALEPDQLPAVPAT